MLSPKTTFLSTTETEAQRLIQIAISIVNRFFQKKGFLVLPYDQHVYFPDLKYPKSFWNEAKRLAKSSWINMPLGTKAEIIKQIVEIISDPPPPVSKLESRWRKMEKPFWQFCQTTFPDYKFANYEIWVTRYDRLSSFTQDKAWVHCEASAGDIAEAILSGTFRREHTARGYTWEESEAFVDNLIAQSSLKNKLFPNWRPTLTELRSKEFAREAADSKAYFEKLGYPNEPVFTLKNISSINSFTKTERQILRQLIICNGKILSFENIGDILWGENSLDKYSEYAITKAMQRLRDKISSLGITPELIRTRRGEGYLLVN